MKNEPSKSIDVKAVGVSARWLKACGCAVAEQAASQEVEGDVATERREKLSAWTQIAREEIDEEQKLRAAAETFGVPFLESLANCEGSAFFTEKIPISFARERRILGLVSEGEQLRVVIGKVDSWPSLDVVRRSLNRAIEPAFAKPDDTLSAINAAYERQNGRTEQFLAELDRDDILTEVEQLGEREDLLDVSDRAPVIKLTNLILFEAVKNRASDVHIQPYEDRLVVRMRIDGVLFDSFTVPKALQEEVLSRVKIMGKMNIAEKRLPQDGRATARLGDRFVDLRIASLPTSHGERIVLRLLDKSARLYTLEELGMDEQALKRFRNAIAVEHGLVLVTGPTGSGKSTTLYAALQEIDTKNRNVLTLEDPIEYQLDGVSQTQISEKKGMTFARGLRSVLRQDPDIIMVGEIRDHETAVMAIQSALTGHLVFSTLHTNDAASAVTRLLDLGIEPYLAASSLVAVLAQRLVRRICPHCKQPYRPDDEDLLRLGLTRAAIVGGKTSHGVGCEECRGSGYRERMGVFELLAVDGGIRELIQIRANASDIRTTARTHGMRLLREDGVEKIIAGLTTIDEVARVAMNDEGEIDQKEAAPPLAKIA